MAYETETPFDSVEGAQEYLKLLFEALRDARRDIERDIAGPADSKTPRRLEALRLVLYKLERLEHHLKASCREPSRKANEGPTEARQLMHHKDWRTAPNLVDIM